MLDRTTPMPAALTPILAWRADWTGSRGGHVIDHYRAAQLDAILANDDLLSARQHIDLLPDNLFNENGQFRFGLAPWHVSNSGSWTSQNW